MKIPALFALFLFCSFYTPAAAQEFGPLTYGCPPCGCPGDALNEAAPGPCPVCGMQMSEKAPFRNVAFLIYDHMQLADMAGAFTVFENAKMFSVYTVAQREKPIKTHPSGVTITPHFTLDTCPPPDIIVIPGGSVARISGDTALVGWLKRKAGAAKLVLSIRNGASVLAKTGMLDGLEVTVPEADLESFRKAAPRVTAVGDRKFIESGKFISTSGSYSGIDASLHILSRVFGNNEKAMEVARLIDYRWGEN